MTSENWIRVFRVAPRDTTPGIADLITGGCLQPELAYRPDKETDASAISKGRIIFPRWHPLSSSIQLHKRIYLIHPRSSSKVTFIPHLTKHEPGFTFPINPSC